jgi:hypothetical protein
MCMGGCLISKCSSSLYPSFAGTSVTYSLALVNSGNVKLRGLQLVVPKLAGNSSDGSITCTDTTSGNSWLAGTDLASNASLSCSGSYTLNQDAIEAGDLSPVAIVTAANLANAVTAALPSITVPSMPQLLANVDTAGCTMPQSAGECAVVLEHALPVSMCLLNMLLLHA